MKIWEINLSIIYFKLGYNVQGVFMRNWDIVDEKGYCQADVDRADAEYVCKKIGIPFSEVNFVKAYWNNIFRLVCTGICKIIFACIFIIFANFFKEKFGSLFILIFCFHKYYSLL